MIITKKRRARAVNKPVKPHLIALTEGTSIPLDKPILLIGRHQECDVQIVSRKISRRHCCIALLSDHIVVRDLGSTNGIRINGIKVVEGNLQPNDELTIGNMRYQVSWTGETAQAAEKLNGIKAGGPVPKLRPGTEESLEEPIPLSDLAMYPVKQAVPSEPHKAPSPAANSKNESLQIPDNIGLAPLDPPKN